MKDFVNDPFDIPGDQATRIRRMLNLHVLRPIPAKIVTRFRTLWALLANANKAVQTVDLALLCAQVCTVKQGKIKGRAVVLVDGEDLSLDPTPPPAEPPKKKG